MDLEEYASTPEPSPPCTPCKRKSVELEEDSEPDADTIGPATPTREPTLRHFKAQYDQLWDYKKICQKFFISSKPYLAVKEHPVTNAHVHFQGYSYAGDDAYEAMRGRLSKTHHLRKENKNKRPVSVAKRAVTDIGFQYMCKDLSVPPLAVNLFTPEDLATMKAHSTMLVQELKANLRNYIGTMAAAELKQACNGNTAEDLINAVSLLIFKHVKAGKLPQPKYSRHTRTDIINGLLELPFISDKAKSLLFCSK